MAEEQEQKLVFEKTTDFGFGGGKKYIPAPVGEPLEAYISNIQTVNQINNYKTSKDGKPNPTYGKLVPNLVVAFRLEESDAAGQDYSAWITKSYDEVKDEFYLALSDKSNMGKVAIALTGSAKGIQTMSPDEVIGMRLRVTLKPSTTNPDRQVVDLTKLFPTKNPEKRKDLSGGDIVLTDIPEAEDAMSAFDKALEG